MRGSRDYVYDILDSLNKNRGICAIIEGSKYYFHSKNEFDRFLRENPQYSKKDLQTGKKGGKFIELRKKDESYINEKAEKVATDRVKRATSIEPSITNPLRDLVHSFGGDLNHENALSFKVKTVESLTRKLITDSVEKEIPIEKMEAKIYDVNRYTSVVEPDKMASHIESVFNAMEKKGFKIRRIKNTMSNPSAPYRGVNCVLESSEGDYFELQFHTPQSLSIKNINHKLYEEQRKDETPKERKIKLDSIMAENARSIEVPKGMERIHSFDNLKS